jgi:hypothetical protein
METLTFMADDKGTLGLVIDASLGTGDVRVYVTPGSRSAYANTVTISDPETLARLGWALLSAAQDMEESQDLVAHAKERHENGDACALCADGEYGEEDKECEYYIPED